MKKSSERKRRSDVKVMTKEATILKIMRESRKLSMRRAAKIAGVSDAFINHVENGRMDITPKIILKLINIYGYELKQFEEFKTGKKELPEALRSECIEIIKRISFEKLKLVKGILASF